ncbi:MAG: hypothetical protein ACE5GW_01035 [Planctomycetota bacterium]
MGASSLPRSRVPEEPGPDATTTGLKGSASESGGPGDAGPSPEAPARSAPLRKEDLPRFARLYDEAEKVDGGSRWAVGGAGRSCGRCLRELTPGETFYTVLLAARAAPSTGSVAGVTALFERADYCSSCFALAPIDRAFAHWRSFLPPPPESPRRTVNLASLYSTFLQLGDAGEESVGEGDAEARITSSERARVRFLLALFLVRKRVLKWGALRGDRLLLRCRQSGETHEIGVPPEPREELEQAVEAFAALFL